ncbi:FAD-dependent oxidoreductase [Saccharibacillus alkalitolerans]|uniref:NAD(P)-binding protein n=1 Tax=Saccharibacillus alkalitolerans TaxID=2705290 RepID=A0ABX0F451_9BACL|nr:FAD-dependent monooxygenase [Saccharibacillus alkalitolerans]NGZ74403.1 NAD(P)-binding protein [Saccharibacillus alkalitolerans]
MRIGIIGGGIGGLTLAQALKRAGAACIVFDRDPSPEKTGGYRLHLSGEALACMRRALPEEIVRSLSEVGTGSEAFKQFSVLDHRRNTRLALPVNGKEDILMIGRMPLRNILTWGLEQSIRWDAAFSAYEEKESGIVLHFSNKTSEEVDLLIGADGVNSAVARQLLGRRTARSAGVTAIAGRTPLTSGMRRALYADLQKGPGFAVGPGGIGMFLSVHDPAERALSTAAAEISGVREEPYLIWSTAAENGMFPSDLRTAGPERLAAEALKLIEQ